ncbi:MAG: ATP-grasp domain-containing protein, partial [Patescibacteria group bacterium]
KRKLYKEGIGTPNFRIINRRSDIRNIKGLEYPLIVKPSGGHAAIGITQDSVVIDQDELEERVRYLFDRMPGEVIVEEYIEGREIHVTVLGNGKRLATLPYAELAFSGEYSDNWSVYSYNAKWNKSSWEYWNLPVIVADKISRKLDARIEKLCFAAFAALNCCDVARFDLRVDDKERVYLLDANMCPSLENNDGDATWQSAKRINWSYEDLIETIVGIAYKRLYGKYPKRLRDRSLMLTA